MVVISHGSSFRAVQSMSKGKLKFKTLDAIFVVGAILASILVLILIKDGTNRFTFIMPIFAGLIFYFILTLEEDNKEDKD